MLSLLFNILLNPFRHLNKSEALVGIIPPLILVSYPLPNTTTNPIQ
jgi:hypothetical protein